MTTYPPRMDYRLSAIRAALNAGLVVRLSLDEMSEVVHHLQRFDIVPSTTPCAAHVITAFRLERLAIQCCPARTPGHGIDR